MKKILLFALPLLAMIAVSCQKDNGELSGDDIIEFKDPNFLKALLTVQEIDLDDEETDTYLMDVDANKDGKISVNEAQKVKGLVLLKHIQGTEEWRTFNIREMPEIKYFTALTSLSCPYNQLTSLDLSKNTALEYLECHENQLTTLDVSGCTALKDLGCDENKLTTLDLSKNTALTYLGCYDNQLTTLDVSGCTALDGLECYDNQLTSLDLSRCAALTELNCGRNQLTTLDISGCTKLGCFTLSVFISPNPLKKIWINVNNQLGADFINAYKDIIEYVE